MLEKMKTNNIFKKYGFTLFLLLLILCVTGGVAAKYVAENGGIGVFRAKEFYFTSNLLKSEKELYVLNSDATEVTFTLGNNADKLRFSEDDIHYTVTVDDDNDENTSNSIMITNQDDEENMNPFQDVIEGKKVSVDSITVKNLEKGKVYTVTAVGKAGYKETLSADLMVAKDEENVYYHVNNLNEEVIILTVWSENLKGELTVKFPEGLIADATDPVMEDVVGYLNDSTLSFFLDKSTFTQEYSSRVYRFFVDSDHSNSDFNASSFNGGVILSIDATTSHVASFSTPK